MPNRCEIDAKYGNSIESNVWNCEIHDFRIHWKLKLQNAEIIQKDLKKLKRNCWRFKMDDVSICKHM
jgi:hypothetical protein